ncbi:MAG: FkbM family methyltransferase [Deltaproteobacteria bacterium]|nr:FkbM family methyltransferase [Deltaproteobacteria bacterium]
MRYGRLIRTFSNWWLYLALKSGMVRRDIIIWTTRTGLIVKMPLRLLQTFKEIFMDECYMKGLERPAPKGATVIDVGANAGYFSLFAAHKFQPGRIIAFEPMPSNYALLQDNRNLNPRINLDCIASAVSGRPGHITLSFDPSDSFTTSATVFTEYHPGESAVTVPSLDLPAIFTQYGVERCHLLKMDCEGAEYDILYDCPAELFPRIDQMALEVHGGPRDGQDIDSLSLFLKKQGFATRMRPVGMLWAWRT